MTAGEPRYRGLDSEGQHDLPGPPDPAGTDPELLETAQVLGYSFLPEVHRESPGYSGLMVALRDRPSTKHFEPEMLHVRTCEPAGDVRSLRLTRTAVLEHEERLCAGRIVLSAASGERVELFSFGGTLQQLPHPELCLFLLRSPVPLLELTEDESVAGQLSTEAEALLAEIDAAGGPDQESFQRSLAAQDPVRLYAATIHSILDRFHRSESLEATYHRLGALLRSERLWLHGQGLWPSVPPSLSELFSSPAAPSA